MNGHGVERSVGKSGKEFLDIGSSNNGVPVKVRAATICISTLNIVYADERTYNCMEKVLSMLAPKPRYNPAIPCSLRMRINILRAPPAFLTAATEDADAGRTAEEARADLAESILVAATSVWILVLTLQS